MPGLTEISDHYSKTNTKNSNTMTPISQNTTMSYEPVNAGQYSLAFAKSVKGDKTSVYATPKTEDGSKGYVGYSSDDDSVNISIKGLGKDGISKLGEILGAIGNSISEILSE